MHEPSFMALALIVSEKTTLHTKTRKKIEVSEPYKVGQGSTFMVAFRFTHPDVCMAQVLWL